jgi:hypothetical protein
MGKFRTWYGYELNSWIASRPNSVPMPQGFGGKQRPRKQDSAIPP